MTKIAEETFTVSKAAIVCAGSHDLSKNTDWLSKGLIDKCNRGMNGQINVVTVLSTKEFRVRVGPASLALDEYDNLGKALIG